MKAKNKFFNIVINSSDLIWFSLHYSEGHLLKVKVTWTKMVLTSRIFFGHGIVESEQFALFSVQSKKDQNVQIHFSKISICVC